MKGDANSAYDGDNDGAYAGKTTSCGDITITNGVTSVTATKGGVIYSGTWNIIGTGNNSTCGTVTIDGVANPTPATATAASGTLFPNLDSVVNGNTWTLTHPSE